MFYIVKTSGMLSEYGSEYDANSALAELDKALRSNNIGEKAEIIVKVPTYFERYPFPVFVNSVFLKLTEVFRGSTNFLRKCVLRVAERSETHLDKIISRDEVAKRIMNVSYSNDPVARSLTLRLLGCLSHVFGGRQQIHHLIRTSLDSKDTEELNAAIFAAERFAQHSEEFSNAIYDKVAEMLIKSDVSLEIKIAVVPVFQHMHTDPVTTDKVFNLCKTQLLHHSQSPALICSILRTLTGLALSSLTVFSVQIELLLDALNNSSKFSVKRTATYCMIRIAKQAPQFWNKEVFTILCNYIGNVENTEKYNVLRLDVLKILLNLTKNKIIVAWGDLTDVASKLLHMCSFWISLKLDKVLAANCEVLANLIKHSGGGPILIKNSEMDSIASEFYNKLVNIIPIWNWADTDVDMTFYAKKLLRSIVVFCQRYTNFAFPISRSICSLLDGFSDDKESLIFETLFALLDCEPSVIDIFQSVSNKIKTYKWHFLLVSSNQISSYMEDLWSGLNGWELYKLGRFACRYGKHASAYRIFQRTEELVVSDYFYHWIKALTTLSLAECHLSNNEKYSDTLSLYTKTLFYLKAAIINSHNLWFPIEYVTLKIEFLKIIENIRIIWNISRITPPPSTLLMSSNGAAILMAQLVEKFSDCINSLNILADKYEKLMGRCFDADLNSLNSLRLERIKCQLVQQCLMSILDKDIQSLSLPDKETLNACCLLTVGHLQNAANQVALLQKETDKLSVDVINKALIIIDDLARKPTYFAPFFFQSVQTTVKLVVSPQPNASENSVTLPADQNLAIKVEGVVQYGGSKKKKFRHVHEILLQISTEFFITNSSNSKGAPMEQTIEKSVKPHNDYFFAEFVLQFPQPGLITVRTSVIDDVEGRLWDIGTEEQLRVKVVGFAGGKQQIGHSNLTSLTTITSSPINHRS